MSGRQEHDAPARIIAASIGAVLILVATPFTVKAYLDLEAEPNAFVVAWSQNAGSAISVSAGNSATLKVSDALVALVEVTSTACTDSADTPQGSLQNPASITVTVTRKVGTQTTTVGTRTYECASVPAPLVMNLTDSPGIGTITGADAEDAGRNLEARVADSRLDADYTVQMTVQRQANQVPSQIPGVQPTLTATAQLKVTSWVAAIAPSEATA